MIDVFLVCPVRNAAEEQRQRMNEYINKLELEGKIVYYPARDTDQTDNIGFRICTDNKNAICEAKEIHIFWDKTSQGSLFDIGMAFALNKTIKIVNPEDLELTEMKSFINMIDYWSKQIQ